MTTVLIELLEERFSELNGMGSDAHGLQMRELSG